MLSQLENRYPGIRFFERDEQKLFFGRKEECLDLQSMIKVKKLVVLFAKSGIGKSSLINAGLIPQMEKENFCFVKVRFQDKDFSPVEFVRKALTPFHQSAIYQKYATEANPNVSLWEYLRACHFGDAENAKMPVFVFDQFEEFFNHPAATQKELIIMLANLINNRLPDEVRERMREIPRSKRTREDLNWFSPIPVKIILSIRSDKLSFLDELSTEIPIILRNRFHLKPLKIEQAREAIVEPASLQGDNFLVQPFGYKESALSEILDHLSNDRGEIESFQLQILCQQIEREVWKRRQRNT